MVVLTEEGNVKNAECIQENELTQLPKQRGKMPCYFCSLNLSYSSLSLRQETFRSHPFKNETCLKQEIVTVCPPFFPFLLCDTENDSKCKTTITQPSPKHVREPSQESMSTNYNQKTKGHTPIERVQQKEASMKSRNGIEEVPATPRYTFLAPLFSLFISFSKG